MATGARPGSRSPSPGCPWNTSPLAGNAIFDTENLYNLTPVETIGFQQLILEAIGFQLLINHE